MVGILASWPQNKNLKVLLKVILNDDNKRPLKIANANLPRTPIPCVEIAPLFLVLFSPYQDYGVQLMCRRRW